MTRQPAAQLVDPLLSVVRPVYNERDTVDDTFRRVLAVPVRFEPIVVDECSTDGTGNHLQALPRELGFTLILQPANGGKGAEACFTVVICAEVLRSMTLRSNRFGIEPELTAKIFKRGHRVYEIPITDAGRGYSEGKTITWRDGIVAIWALLKYRFTE